LPGDLKAVDVGHQQVQQHDINLHRINALKRLPAIGRLQTMVANVGDKVNQLRAAGVNVVNHQHSQ